LPTKQRNPARRTRCHFETASLALSVSVCHIVQTKPDTTYDNFARDFGERFVPGYKPMSTVDFLMQAPFEQ
jgi:hypothetical protein